MGDCSVRRRARSTAGSDSRWRATRAREFLLAEPVADRLSVSLEDGESPPTRETEDNRGWLRARGIPTAGIAARKAYREGYA